MGKQTFLQSFKTHWVGSNPEVQLQLSKIHQLKKTALLIAKINVFDRKKLHIMAINNVLTVDIHICKSKTILIGTRVKAIATYIVC